MIVGGSADNDQTQPVEWAVQIHKRCGMTDKVFGRNPHRSDDPRASAVRDTSTWRPKGDISGNGKKVYHLPGRG